MMNENPSQPIATPDAALSLVGAGRILAQAREQAGLTCEEAAARLRLSPRQVSALESGNVDALPGPAFVRGFIRNYAKLLKIDAEPLLESCRAYAPDTKPVHISLHTENILIEGRERKSWQSYLIVAVVVGAVLAGWMWYMGYESQAPADVATETTAQEQQPVPLFGDNAPVAPAPAEPAPAAPEAMMPAPPEAVTPPAPDAPQTPGPAATAPPSTAAGEIAPPAATPAPAPATARLKLSFTESGWVSVRDRAGKEIYNKTAPGGSSELVEGAPPFKIVLGNAIGMQVTYNDAPVDLSPHIKGSVARFTLE